MELSFEQQTLAFLLSVPLGVLLGAGYGVFKFCRYAFLPGRAATVALDILFMLLWAMSVFFFSLGYLMGYIRFYVFLGSFLGFLLYRLTLGRLFFHIYRPVLRFLRVIFHKSSVKIKIFAKYLLKIAGNLLYNISVRVERFRNKRTDTKRKSNELVKTKNKKRKHCFRRANRRRSHGNRQAEKEA